MKRQRLLLRLMLKAAWVRKDRALTALLSIAVVATMATVALTVYSDLEGKFSREFRSFGANVIVTRQQGSFTPEELARISTIVGNKGEVVPIAYVVATIGIGSKIVVGGADLKKLVQLNSWWSVDSRDCDYCQSLVGSRVRTSVGAHSAFILNLNPRGSYMVRGEPFDATFTSGSDDDSRVYLDLPHFMELTVIGPGTALVRIAGPPAKIEQE